MLWDTCRYIRRMESRLAELPHACVCESWLYEHGTHFAFPQSMLKQMLPVGDRLLVAPVFDPEGKVTYYVPDGEWYHFFTGEKITGGCWRTETCDFLSLPLLVRGGTVLPVGACDTRPDYDYADGVGLRAYGLKEGQAYTLSIPTVKGAPYADYTVTRQGDALKVDTGADKPFKAVSMD